MQKRSKFLTIVLSCIPGVGHLYLGLMTRGFTFMVAFFGWITFVAFLAIASHQDSFLVLLLVIPILWFYSFFDALHMRRKIVSGEPVADISPIAELTQATEKGKRSKVWALVFSFIPGAGHMYLGYKEQGLQLMAAFFLCLFVMDWLQMTFMIFLIPIIWFYSMFDALQKTSQSEGANQDDFVFADWVNKNHRLLAFLLIGLGLLLIVNKFIFGFVMWQYNQYIQTAVVSLLLIAGGIRLLRGAKIEDRPEETFSGSNDEQLDHYHVATLTEDDVHDHHGGADSEIETEFETVKNTDTELEIETGIEIAPEFETEDEADADADADACADAVAVTGSLDEEDEKDVRE